MKRAERIVIVDDEVDFAKGLARLVASSVPEPEISLCFCGREALEALEAPEAAPAAVMLLDLNMPGMHGMEVLEKALKMEPNLSIIVLTAYASVENAVTALQNGACDFLTKPVRREDLIRSLLKGLERNRLLTENRRLHALMDREQSGRMIIGDSAVLRRLRDKLCAVAASSYTVLIRGESGTGKEAAAATIHRLSKRNGQPFVTVNCPAIPESLLESELFGHARGAFTGAVSAHKGLFAQAAGGTLVLDEIGDIPPGIQTKLLRVLQEGEVRPVGSNKSMRVDTRIIAVTNQDLEAKIREGSFREDLFYRLNVLSIRMPPLREHAEDIPLLAAHFLSASCAEMGTESKTLSPAAATALCGREWPGNVRELQNFIRRVTVFSGGPVVEAAHLRFGEETENLPAQTGESGTYKEAKAALLDAFTRRYTADILRRTGGNISESARISGIERVSLQKIMRRLGMDAEQFKK